MGDHWTSIMIMLNGVFIGALTQYSAVNTTEAVPGVYTMFEGLFCVFFTMELIFRIYNDRINFFLDPAMRGWNAFDTMLVILQLIELVGQGVKDLLMDSNEL